MKRLSILLLLLVFRSATAMQAQAQAPKPDPALKKLSVLVGHWTYEGEFKTGPLGPGGKVTGDWTTQVILGGFFFQARFTEKGPAGEARGLRIYGYDPVNKNFSSQGYGDNGSTFSGVLAVAQNTYIFTGKLVVAGKPYQGKATFVLAADLASGTQKAEISSDGKTWTPWFEEKFTKVQPAAKK
jgi:hypothetical protein